MTGMHAPRDRDAVVSGAGVGTRSARDAAAAVIAISLRVGRADLALLVDRALTVDASCDVLVVGQQPFDAARFVEAVAAARPALDPSLTRLVELRGDARVDVPSWTIVLMSTAAPGAVVFVVDGGRSEPADAVTASEIGALRRLVNARATVAVAIIGAVTQTSSAARLAVRLHDAGLTDVPVVPVSAGHDPSLIHRIATRVAQDRDADLTQRTGEVVVRLVRWCHDELDALRAFDGKRRPSHRDAWQAVVEHLSGLGASDAGWRRLLADQAAAMAADLDHDRAARLATLEADVDEITSEFVPGNPWRDAIDAIETRLVDELSGHRGVLRRRCESLAAVVTTRFAAQARSGVSAGPEMWRAWPLSDVAALDVVDDSPERALRHHARWNPAAARTAAPISALEAAALGRMTTERAMRAEAVHDHEVVHELQRLLTDELVAVAEAWSRTAASLTPAGGEGGDAAGGAARAAMLRHALDDLRSLQSPTPPAPEPTI